MTKETLFVVISFTFLLTVMGWFIMNLNYKINTLVANQKFINDGFVKVLADLYTRTEKSNAESFQTSVGKLVENMTITQDLLETLVDGEPNAETDVSTEDSVEGPPKEDMQNSKQLAKVIPFVKPSDMNFS
jgi:hypothetical protein